MKDYKQFIRQLPTNTIVCALGEFNPPTTAHELLVKTVKVVAEQKSADHLIFTSPSELINEEKKEQFLKLMFPKTKIKSLGEAFFAATVKQLSEKYRRVVIIAGADQFAEFKNLKECANVEIISIGDKDPDVNNAKMKQYATKGLYEEFKKLLPSTIRDIDGKRLMNEMRSGLGLETIKEQLVLVKDKLREDYFKGKIFNVGDIVESNGQQYEIVKRGSNHLLLKEESGELVSKWIQDVKQVKEGVIQPNGTDKIDPNAPESDTGAKQDMKPKGKTKGFLTFYNYKKDQQNEQHIPVPQTPVDSDKDSESDLDTFNGVAKVFDPTHVGHMLVQPGTSHHVRRMKVKYHLGEETIEEQTPPSGAIGTQHTGSMHHTKSPSTDKFHDKQAKAKIKATLALKHAKEKEDLSHKQERETNALRAESFVEFKNKKQKETKGEDCCCSRSGNKNAVGAENIKSMSEDIDIPKDAPSVETIAKKHNVSVEQIKKALAIGMKVEAEHGKNPGSEKEIALDHLNERPDYYTRLKKFVEQVNETKLNPLDPHGDYKAKSKALQDIQLDPHTHKDPELKAELIRSKAALEKEYEPHRVKEEVELQEEKPEESADRKKQLKRFKKQADSSLLTQDRPGMGTEFNQYNDPFFKEELLLDPEIEAMVESVTDEDIEDLYEEDEIVLVYDDTGEEVEPIAEEAQIDLMEVLSRQERLRGKIRLRKTAAKRGRSTKIALKRFSNPQTINKRARRLAIKLMKKRIVRGRNIAKLSVPEKERVEKMIASRKTQIDRIALKLVPRIRKVEKARMSHGKVTKGAMPSVF